ncbi:MAG: DUF998 domain-containing protein [Candidatus Hodarchaeales archaeon]|jgi:hypothetical membrane protein
MYKKSNWIKLGPFFGLAATMTMLSFTLIAFFLYPGYDVLGQTLSKLGARPGTGILFNVGVILSGLLFIPFYYSLHLRFSHERRYLAGFRLLTGVLGAIFLISVGVFPDVPGLVMIHIIVAFLFFLFTGMAIVLLSYEIIKYKWLEPFYGWLGIVCFGATLFHGYILSGLFCFL